MLCRCASFPVDALLPWSYCFGECFATIVFFKFGGCFPAVSSSQTDALPPWLCYLVDTSPPFRVSCLPSLNIFGWQNWSALPLGASSVVLFGYINTAFFFMN
jgi:hypothetical protein